MASDYLTLSTFDVEAYTWAVRLIRGYTPEDERKVGRWLQYEGLAGDGYFVGAGDQAGGRHYVVRLSGSVAHSFLAVALRQGAMLARFKCTRFDVQYTRPEAPSVRLEEVGKLLEAADWSHHKGKKPKIEWWHNAEGYDTLYIGSRSSVRLQRIYVKPVDGRDCLRWEVEYKGELAGKLFAAVLASGLSVLAGVLAGEMVVLPVLACPELVALVDDVKGGNKPERLKLVRDRTPELRSLQWLWECVLPCVRRLQSNDPEVKRSVDEFLAVAWSFEAPDLPPSAGSLLVEHLLEAWQSEGGD